MFHSNVKKARGYIEFNQSPNYVPYIGIFIKFWDILDRYESYELQKKQSLEKNAEFNEMCVCVYLKTYYYQC